jgi:hypothetical protein
MSTAVTSIAVSLGLLGFATAPRAADASAVEAARRPIASPTSDQVTRSKRDASTVVIVTPLTNQPLLQIENLRLDNPPPKVAQPAALLKFDVFNDTSLRLTDVVMRVSFLEKQAPDIADVPARVLVGPVTVRVTAVLQAESVLSYEMLFRNLSSDCDCSPSVEILSARLLPD